MIMKNKAFTLVELLAVLVILAVLLTLVVVSVGKIISNSQSDLSEQQKRNIELAAEAYNIDRGDLDSIDACVNVSTLINLGYLEGSKVVDPATKQEMTGSVRITYASNQYTYKYQEQSCSNE